ncbi:MAG: hypothetical protein AB7T27_08730 [Kiritimatiellia bacterium]
MTGSSEFRGNYEKYERREKRKIPCPSDARLPDSEIHIWNSRTQESVKSCLKKSFRLKEAFRISVASASLRLRAKTLRSEILFILLILSDFWNFDRINRIYRINGPRQSFPRSSSQYFVPWCLCAITLKKCPIIATTPVLLFPPFHSSIIPAFRHSEEHHPGFPEFVLLDCSNTRYIMHVISRRYAGRHQNGDDQQKTAQ